MTQKDIFKARGEVAAYFDGKSLYIDCTICFKSWKNLLWDHLLRGNPLSYKAATEA